jgi:hypothetical protein
MVKLIHPSLFLFIDGTHHVGNVRTLDFPSLFLFIGVEHGTASRWCELLEIEIDWENPMYEHSLHGEFHLKIETVCTGGIKKYEHSLHGKIDP